VITAGVLVKAPLTKVPENTLKFVVGVMLTSFGTYWAAEGFNYNWPLADAFIPILAVIYLAASYLLVIFLKQQKRRQLAVSKAQVMEEVRP